MSDSKIYTLGDSTLTFPDTTTTTEIYSVESKGTNHPCDNCSNNPKNNPHASGVCHCVLGSINVTC